MPKHFSKAKLGAVLVAAGWSALWTGPAAGSMATAHPADSQGTLNTLAHGLAESMHQSAAHLLHEGERLQATQALDESRRVARVLSEATTDADSLRTPAQRGLDAVRRARHALQMGDPQKAAGILETSSIELRTAADENPLIMQAADHAALAAGTNVIDARGARLGEVAGITTGEDGRQYAELKVGGTIDVFGFIDFGNRRAMVPLRQLIVGGDMAALATDVPDAL